MTESSTKACPHCTTLVPVGALECAECGYEWERPKVEEWEGTVEMREVPIQRQAETVILENVVSRHHVSRAGTQMLKLVLTGRLLEWDTSGEKQGRSFPVVLYHFMDLEGEGSAYGQRKACRLWSRLGGRNPVSETIREAMDRFSELAFPQQIDVARDGKYLRVAGW